MQRAERKVHLMEGGACAEAWGCERGWGVRGALRCALKPECMMCRMVCWDTDAGEIDCGRL